MPVEVIAGRWLRITKSKARSGRPKVSATDLLAAMVDPDEMRKQDPRAPKPRIMVETMRIVGDVDLTAQDRAMYEILLAWARKHGLDKDTHEIPADAMKGYLGTANWSDIKASMARLSSAQVQYDFRDEEWRRHGRIALVNVGIKESLKDSAAKFVEFEIPSRIRAVMASARDYAKIELAAFPKFRCKYTSTFYQRLALRAGYDERLIKPWEMTPLKLAEDLGYPLRGGRLHYGEFRARCLEPMLDDLAHGVSRFMTSLEEVRGSGRGRPVEKLVWTVSPAFTLIHERPMASINGAERLLLEAPDTEYPASALPKAQTLRRVCRFLHGKLSIRELHFGWRAALDEMTLEANSGNLDNDLAAPVADVDICGSRLGELVARIGADSAFYAWAVGNAETLRIRVRESRSAARAQEAQRSRNAEADHAETFASAVGIVIRLDHEVLDAALEAALGKIESHQWSGDREMSVTLEMMMPEGLSSIDYGSCCPSDLDLNILRSMYGVMAVGYAVPPKPAPEPETPEERKARLEELDVSFRISAASAMVEGLKTMPPPLVLDMLDGDMPFWLSSYKSLPNGGRQLRAALKVVEDDLRKALRGGDDAYSSDAYAAGLRQAKSTLMNLGRAARYGDWERLSKVSTAILAASKAPTDNCPF